VKNNLEELIKNIEESPYKKPNMYRLITAVLVILLSGCVNSKMNIVQPYSPEKPMADNHGVVIARVLNASPYPYDFNYITLTPKDVYEAKENKFQRMLAFTKIGSKSSFFTSQIAAGEYSFANVYSYYNFGNYYYQFFGSVKPSFGTFKVEPGKVTDLGTIIYYRKPDGDVYYNVVTRKDDQGLSLELLDQHAPTLAKKLAGQTVLQWDEDEHLDDRSDQYLNLAQNPVVYNNAYPQTDGSWVFTSPLGIMLTRDEYGEWGLDGIETDYDLIYYSQNSHGDQLVSATDNSLYIKSGSNEQWSSITPPNFNDIFNGSAKNLHLAEVHMQDNQNMVAIYRNEYTAVLMTKHNGATDEWTTSLIYSKNYGWLPFDDYQQKEVERIALAQKKPSKKYKPRKHGGIIVKVHQGTIFSAIDKKLYKLNVAEQKATLVSNDFKVERLDQNGLNQMMISRVSLWDGSTVTEFSLDKGKSWKTYTHLVDRCPDNKAETKQPLCRDGKRKFTNYNHVTQPVFFSDGTAYSIFSKTRVNFWTSTRSTTYSMVKSSDSGQSWILLPIDLPKHCTNLLKASEVDLLLNCQNTTGQFYRTSKEEIDWQVDHEPTVF
jgi:hypothetical protein